MPRCAQERAGSSKNWNFGSGGFRESGGVACTMRDFGAYLQLRSLPFWRLSIWYLEATRGHVWQCFPNKPNKKIFIRISVLTVWVGWFAYPVPPREAAGAARIPPCYSNLDFLGRPQFEHPRGAPRNLTSGAWVRTVEALREGYSGSPNSLK